MTQQDLVVAVVVRKGDQLLLIQEGDEDKYGKWNLPTGQKLR